MEVPHHWRLKKQRYALEGRLCMRCGERTLANRAVCPRCGSGIVRVETAAFPVSDYQEPVLESVSEMRNR